ncbi:MAG: M3 family oligoendopeptidase [Candidatus Sericytochromatia bacterium]|nr:M3 family oligoendopeptidase [Candidatus Sericytochromatia bacterium]
MCPVASLRAPLPLSQEEVRARFLALEDQLPSSQAPVGDWEAWYWQWNEAKLQLQGEASRRYFRECQDTRDEAAKEAWRALREEILPIAEEINGRLRKAFLGAECRAELESSLGGALFQRLSLEDAGFTPENIPLGVQEQGLVAQYDQLLGGAQLPLETGSVTLVKAQSLLAAEEPEQRQAAWRGIGQFFDEHGASIHGILDGLVQLRHQQARNLGEDDFLALGYRRMGRTEYGPAEVARFREAIRDHVVPLTRQLRAVQARDLGLNGPCVPGADMMYFPNATLGDQAAPVEEQIARADALFGRLHPQFLAHWRRMTEEGLIDLENRPGKKPGAFAMSLDDERRAVIFCNSTGRDADISTLTHEMGHAVQAWESMWVRSLELRTPTMDAAEVHSFGMEYLALHEIESFFAPADAARFRRMRLMTTLVRLPYMAAVDAFQHALYERPGMTPAEREAVWADLWDTFMAGIDVQDCPAQRQYRWMRQAHIFASPFYYIDYALAEVAALQIWQRAQHDRAGATDAYLTICRLGGTTSLLGMLEAGGLRSPFDPSVLPELIGAIAREVGLNDA